MTSCVKRAISTASPSRNTVIPAGPVFNSIFRHSSSRTAIPPLTLNGQISNNRKTRRDRTRSGTAARKRTTESTQPFQKRRDAECVFLRHERPPTHTTAATSRPFRKKTGDRHESPVRKAGRLRAAYRYPACTRRLRQVEAVPNRSGISFFRAFLPLSVKKGTVTRSRSTFPVRMNPYPVI